jgi:hypothetical protein
MVIFHCYVSLSEGMHVYTTHKKYCFFHDFVILGDGKWYHCQSKDALQTIRNAWLGHVDIHAN